MRYRQARDIDPEAEFDAAELDRRLNVLCVRTAEAIDRSSIPPLLRDQLSNYVTTFRQTHNAILSLCRTTFEHEGHVGDAL